MKYQGKNYINGEWREAVSAHYVKKNPSTGEGLGNFPLSGPTEVGEAVSSARETFHRWRKVSRFVRSDYMNKDAQ